MKVQKGTFFGVNKKEKPADYQRVKVVLGRIELPTHGFSVHCSTI